MLDNIDVENIEVMVDEYRELKAEHAKNGGVSEDLLNDSLKEIGDAISLKVYTTDGFNTFILDADAVEQLSGEHFRVEVSGGVPVLMIDGAHESAEGDEVRLGTPVEPSEE